ncbi:uncharacterized protein [Nicotiana tomentosiformis]|uniref:uncharacterized protein n=1 Tax=Nicotiana tomentosiformis TaxID=4098 RepID=UPI00388C607D
MAKISKIVPQKEKASSSRPSGDKAPVEPPLHEYVPGRCILKIDFKVENPSSVPGLCVTKDAILRPSSGEEGTKSPVPEPGKDKKRKAVSRSEDPKHKTRRAISKFRVDLSQCEVKLQKVSGERDSLQLLCSQNDEVIKDLQADLAKACEEEAELDKQAKRIEEFETRLAEAKAEIESSKVMADKSIAVYRVDAEVAQMEEKEAANTADTRAHWAVELAKCRSRRETLEEIHARGFDLAEEIKRATKLEADVEALASDDDDDDDGSKSGSKNGGEPGGEETALDDNPEA